MSTCVLRPEHLGVIASFGHEMFHSPEYGEFCAEALSRRWSGWSTELEDECSGGSRLCIVYRQVHPGHVRGRVPSRCPSHEQSPRYTCVFCEGAGWTDTEHYGPDACEECEGTGHVGYDTYE